MAGRVPITSLCDENTATSAYSPGKAESDHGAATQLKHNQIYTRFTRFRRSEART